MKLPIFLAALVLVAGASPASATDSISEIDSKKYCSENWKDSTKACLEAFTYAQAVEQAAYLKDLPKQPKGFIKYLPEKAKKIVISKQDELLDNHTNRLVTAMA